MPAQTSQRAMRRRRAGRGRSWDMGCSEGRVTWYRRRYRLALVTVTYVRGVEMRKRFLESARTGVMKRAKKSSSEPGGGGGPHSVAPSVFVTPCARYGVFHSGWEWI